MVGKNGNCTGRIDDGVIEKGMEDHDVENGVVLGEADSGLVRVEGFAAREKILGCIIDWEGGDGGEMGKRENLMRGQVKESKLG